MIDSHAHIGPDKAREKLNLPYKCDEELLASLASNNGIKKTIVAPPPGQIFCPHLGEESHPNIYGTNGIPTLEDVKDQEMKFVCVCGETWKTKDPFREVNRNLFEVSLKFKNEPEFVPIPILHPRKPNIEEDVVDFYERYDIKGVKIHPLVDKTNPLEYIGSPLANVLRELDLVVLFHTDSDPYSNPRNLVEFSRRTGIKCQLAHACWGDKDALEAVRDSDRLITDISPIQLLLSQKDRWIADNHFEDYFDMVRYIVEIAGIDNVVAGSDFYWCGWKPETYGQAWQIMEDCYKRLHLPLEPLLYENSQRFWNI